MIGTLARQGVAAGVNVVIVSGDKDFQQLVRPRVWLLNPGRGGPASVEEQWVGGGERQRAARRAPAASSPTISRSSATRSDNVPGVKGIGDKTALRAGERRTATSRHPRARRTTLTKKRPREALLAAGRAGAAVEGTGHDPGRSADRAGPRRDARPRPGLRRGCGSCSSSSSSTRSRRIARRRRRRGLPPPALARVRRRRVRRSHRGRRRTTRRSTRSRRSSGMIARARGAPYIAVDTETRDRSRQPAEGRSAALARWSASRSRSAPGEAYYLPLRHRAREPGAGRPRCWAMPSRASDCATRRTTAQPKKPRAEEGGEAAPSRRASPARALASGPTPVRNLPALDDPRDGAAARAARGSGRPEDGAEREVRHARAAAGRHRAAAGSTSTRCSRATCSIPGRRSHGLDLLALEFLDHTMTTTRISAARAAQQLPFDVVPIDCARDYSCEDADMTLAAAQRFRAAARGAADHASCYRDVEMPLVDVLAEMEWAGIDDRPRLVRVAQGTRSRASASAWSRRSTRARASEFNINSNPQLREDPVREARSCRS